MFISIYGFSLEMEVVEFEYLANEMQNQAGKIIYDEDGQACSVLKVETDLESDLVLAKPTVHKKSGKGGVYYFYIRFRERFIVFGAKGYSPYTWKTPRMLTEGKTYLVKLKAKNEVLGNIPVTILSEPEDATKFINEENLGEGKTFNLKKGEFTLELKKNGYKTLVKKINVSSKNVFFDNLIMEEITPEPYSIETFPSDAYIFLDEKQMGKTPYDDFISPGSYNLKIVKNGYLDKKEKIIIKEGEQNKFSYELTKNSGFVSFDIQPSFAQLKIDNKTYQNWQDIELEPKDYQIEIFAEGYISYNKLLEIKLGDKQNKEIILTENVGFLNLQITPLDATIFIDGKDYSSQKTIKLLPGKYNVDISKKNYLSQNFPIEITLQKAINQKISLVKNMGILELELEPKDAKVSLNNKDYTGQNKIELVEKKYKLKIDKESFHSFEEVIQINRGKTLNKSINLKPMFGKLQFKVEPSNAKITLKKNGKTIDNWQGLKFVKDLYVGDYLLEAKAKDYRSFEKKISIKENKITEEFLKLNSGTDPENYTKFELLKKVSSYKKKKYISLLVSSLGYVLAGYLQYEASKQYDDYNNATSRANSIIYKENTQNLSKYSYITFGISSVPLIPFFYYNNKQKFYENLLNKK